MNISIFGAGAYGSALGETLKSNGHNIKYYDPYKYPDTTVKDALAHSELNLLAVPSHLVASVLSAIPADRPLICATKGFLSDQIFQKYPDFSVLSGPAFADELKAKKPTTLTATSSLVRDLFENDWLKIEQTPDQLGVLLCGSFKNIYAIGSGFHSLSPDTEAFDNYINASIAELRSILESNSCDPATADLSCGIGDLRLTCASTASRNYSFGEQLSKDPTLIKKLAKGTVTLDITTEGYSTAKALATSDLILPSDTPILSEVLNLLGESHARA